MTTAAATVSEIAKACAAHDDRIVARTANGHEFIRRELSDAFDSVKPPNNWKMPIDSCFQTSKDADKSAREVSAVREAVIFFAGCVPEIRHIGNFSFSCKAVGYYMAVGA